MLWRRGRPVFDGLRALGVRVMLLKGAALVDSYGGDWGARPMFDVDVLVRPEHVPPALDVLEELGWVPEYEMTFDWVRSRARTRRHAWGFLREDGRLDLHWHVLQESVGSRSDHQFWAEAVPAERDGIGVLTPAPAALLLHVLEHGVAGDNAPPVQWIADAVHVVRASGDDELGERLAHLAHEHAELRTVHAALGAIATLVDPAPVAPLVDRVTRERRTPVEWLRHGSTATRELAARAAGGNGLLRGGVELVVDRLDLALTSSPMRAVVARGVPGRTGGLARTPAGDAPPIDGSFELEFSCGVTLDRYGGPGWGRPEPSGATARGGAARLVLPLADPLTAADLVVELDLHARDAPATIEVRANEHLVASELIGTDTTRLAVDIPAAVVARFTPLELSLRRARPGRLRARGALRIRLERLRVRRA